MSRFAKFKERFNSLIGGSPSTDKDGDDAVTEAGSQCSREGVDLQDAGLSNLARGSFEDDDGDDDSDDRPSLEHSTGISDSDSSYSNSTSTTNNQNQKISTRVSNFVSKVSGSITGMNYVDKSLRLDDNLHGLYGDTDILERRCKLSLQGKTLQDEEEDDEDLVRIRQEKEEQRKQLLETTSSSSRFSSPQSPVEQLGPDFFRSDFDPTPDIIREVSSWDKDNINEKFMQKIEELDTNKDVITDKLSTLIETNYPNLIECLSNVDIINNDLCDSSLQITQSRKHLNTASSDIEKYFQKAISLRKQQDKLNLVVDIANSLRMIYSIYESIRHDMTTGDTSKACESAFNILYSMYNDGYDRFIALNGMEDKVQTQIYAIRQKIDKALIRLSSRKFATRDYGIIIKSYLLLDFIKERFRVKLIVDSSSRENNSKDNNNIIMSSKQQESSTDHNSNEVQKDISPSSTVLESFGCIEGVAHRVQKYQNDDVENCLRTAALEFVYASHQYVQISKLEDHPSTHPLMNMNDTDIMELDEVPLSDLYVKVIQEMMVPCIVRSCELLLDLVHAHYLMTQWHLTPFHENNNDTAFLHRQPIDLDDVSQEVNFQTNEGTNNDSRGVNTSRKDSSSVQFSTNIRKETKDTILKSFHDFFKCNLNCDKEELDALMEKQGQLLVDLYRDMVTGRSTLWDNVLDGLVKALNTVTFTSSVSLDDFLNMTWAVNAMIKVGKEFCGSESRLLYECLELKSREYYKHLHGEAFDTLKYMITNDSWKNLSINLNELGGVMGVIKGSLPYYDFHRNATSKYTGHLGVRNMTGMIHGANLRILDISGRGSSQSNSNGNKKDINGKSIDTKTTEEEVEEGSFDISKQWSILMFFGVHGNPLHFVSDVSIDNDSENDSEDDDQINEDDEEDYYYDEEKEEVVHKKSNTSRPSLTFEESVNSLLNPKGGFLDASTTNPLIELLNEDLSENSNTSKRKKQAASQQQTSLIVTRSSFHGLTRCAGRYIQMMYLMPSVADKIFSGLRQLFDLYICDVFFGFVSAEEKDKFMAISDKMNAPAPDQSKEFEVLHDYLDRALDEVITFLKSVDESGSGTSPRSAANYVLKTVPVHSVLSVPTIVRACNPKNHFGLNARVVAAESCWFAVTILNAIEPKLCRLLPEEYAPMCRDYVSQFRIIASQLRALIYRTMSPILLKTEEIFNNIVENGRYDSSSSVSMLGKKISTTISKKKKDDNWISILVGNCAAVWKFMIDNDEFKEAAPMVREQVWLELCQAGFDVAMEGFCRLKRVNSDGRKMMLTDVRQLQEGIEEIHPCRTPRGLSLVEGYLEAALLDDEEMMHWIARNWELYAYRFMHGVVKQKFSSVISISGRRLKDALAIVDDLYGFKEAEEDDKKDFQGLFDSGNGGNNNNGKAKEF
jgi:hypothetical protein